MWNKRIISLLSDYIHFIEFELLIFLFRMADNSILVIL